MPLRSLLPQFASAPTQDGQRRFAMRLEDDRLILAVAERGEHGGWCVSTDAESVGTSMMTGADVWREAIDHLKERHHFGREPLAVSLSGDFCVTRISTGPVEDVDQELEQLAGRIPRYLQLGPGGKLTGHVRESIAPGIDHSLTAVANRQRMIWLSDVFAQCDIPIAWIEPSLVSLARMAGWLGLDRDQPILIADSFGKSWEVGIVHQGRLLLDYRPAAAYDSKRFATAIVHHLSRLRRFCQRHRGMDQSDLSQIWVAGDVEKTQTVVDHFANIDDLEARLLEVPRSSQVIDKRVEGDTTIELVTDSETRHLDASDQVAAVAAVLPCLLADDVQSPPDLLQSIRRNVVSSSVASIALTWWPAVAATLLLGVGYGWLAMQRQQFAQQNSKRAYVQEKMDETRVRLASLQSDRFWIEQLDRIREATTAPPVTQLVDQMTRCLPPKTRLTTIRFDSDGQVHLDGITSDETEIYETVGYLRKLPSIDQVALLGTSPNDDQEGSEFQVRLHCMSPVVKVVSP